MEKSDSRALYEMQLTPGMAFIYGPEGEKAHAEAIAEDRDKSYRLVVNIVGKVRQGKTSLRRLLVGEEFNEIEQSTVGIEHELVETLGTAPNISKFWSKVDLAKANVEECNIIVGKHVRKRLERKQRAVRNKAELQWFIKTIVLTYFMLFLYFTAGESEMFNGCPWFPIVLVISLGFSGLLLFDTLRDGFGMAIGTLCLVIYSDAMLRWKSWEGLEHLKKDTCIVWSVIYAFFSFAWIHIIMACSMGHSMAMGFCFMLCLTKPPWNSSILGNSVFMESQLHVFAMSILVGIWSLRHPKVVTGIVTMLSLVAHFIPRQLLYCTISGLGCGFSHGICIKLSFDSYRKYLNPLLKKVASTGQIRRLICYCFGVVPGYFLTSVLEWQWTSKWISHIIFGLLTIAFVEMCHYVSEGKVEANPKPTIKNATKVLMKGEASLKFVIRDFAGHPLYHSVHHIYMTGHCVYLIAFNIAEAKRNFKYAFTDIVYWLQTIFVHDRFPTVRAFIVGTHRDDNSLSKEDIEKVFNDINDNLPRQFYNMVVWNKLTNLPVFPVENSSKDSNDPDHVNLRKQLFNLANDSMKPDYPIKYLYFYRVINQCREQGNLIETLDSISTMCADNDCVVNGDGELEDLLNYFHRCGEIIYNSNDNNQNQLVVMDPKALVDIMASLVRAPPRAERAQEFLLAWNTVADLGIATKKLLYHIIQQNRLVSEEVSVEIVIALLEYLDLVCRLDLGIDGRNITGEKCFLMVPLLKDTLPYPQNYWDDIESDTILYVDFGPVVPKFIFTRLVCQCTGEAHIDVGTDGSYHLNVSTSKALFTFRLSPRQTTSFKLELFDVNDSATPRQQLLKIVIRGNDQDGCLQLTRRICQKIGDIVERDFRKCRYKIGVMCPFKGPHEFCLYQEHHIFSLYENIKPEGAVHQRLRVELPDDAEFCCRGRFLIFRHGQSVTANWTNRRRDGELGRTVRQIEILKMRCPRDPCDALLQDWAASTPEATVSQLLDVMTRMERFDVVRRLHDYMAR